jgi:hypothetical protein
MEGRGGVSASWSKGMLEAEAEEESGAIVWDWEMIAGEEDSRIKA